MSPPRENMTRKPPSTASSMIATVGYDPDTQRLEIEFHATGKVYIYLDVPENIYLDLMAAPSAGRYFNACIAKRYTRLQ